MQMRFSMRNHFYLPTHSHARKTILKTHMQYRDISLSDKSIITDDKTCTVRMLWYTGSQTTELRSYLLLWRSLLPGIQS